MTKDYACIRFRIRVPSLVEVENVVLKKTEKKTNLEFIVTCNFCPIKLFILFIMKILMIVLWAAYFFFYNIELVYNK